MYAEIETEKYCINAQPNAFWFAYARFYHDLRHVFTGRHAWRRTGPSDMKECSLSSYLSERILLYSAWSSSWRRCCSWCSRALFGADVPVCTQQSVLSMFYSCTLDGGTDLTFTINPYTKGLWIAVDITTPCRQVGTMRLTRLYIMFLASMGPDFLIDSEPLDGAGVTQAWSSGSSLSVTLHTRMLQKQTKRPLSADCMQNSLHSMQSSVLFFTRKYTGLSRLLPLASGWVLAASSAGVTVRNGQVTEARPAPGNSAPLSVPGTGAKRYSDRWPSQHGLPSI